MNEIEQAMRATRIAEDKRQTRRALVTVFGVIPVTVGIAVGLWLLSRVLNGG